MPKYRVTFYLHRTEVYEVEASDSEVATDLASQMDESSGQSDEDLVYVEVEELEP